MGASQQKKTALLPPSQLKEMPGVLKNIKGRVNEMTTQIRKQLEPHKGQLTQQMCQENGLKKFDQFCFKNLKQLGKGTFGEVWMCLQIEKREFVAVKYINVNTNDFEKDIENLASFMVEKEILEKISSKNASSIAKFLGAFYQTDDSNNNDVKYVILVSESGDYSLERLVQERKVKSKPYQPQEVLALLSQLSQGYAILQELRIYHSDTKLPNIVFSSESAKFFLIDFGVSKFVISGGDDVSLEDYADAGTEGWFSPEKAFYWECINKEKDLPKDRSTFNPFKDDMWALGTCLEKMLQVSAATYKGDKFLERILKALKDQNIQTRFDANQLSRFLQENGLVSNSPGSLLFQTDLEIAEELNKKRLKKEGYGEFFSKLKDAFLPQEMLKVALEERKELVDKFGEPDLENGVHFIGVLDRLGMAYRSNGNHIEALNCFKLKREVVEKKNGKRECEEMANALFDEGFEIMKLGRNQEALSIYEEVLKIGKMIYNTEEHPDICHTLGLIAKQWQCLGSYQKALDQFLHVLEIQEKLYNTEENADISITLSNIAYLWQRMGSNQKALELYLRVFEIRKKIYKTEEHQDVCITLGQIAAQWSYLGLYQKALDQYQRVLEIQKKIYKTEEHPDICITLSNIAYQWQQLGLYQKALDQYLHVLEIRKKIFKTEEQEHQSVCDTLFQIATQRFHLNQLPEALAEYEVVLKLQRKIFITDNHPDIQLTLENIQVIKDQFI